MNKLLMGLILALGVSFVAMAEPDMDNMAEKRTEHLTKELGLSSEQKTKVEAIFATQMQKMKAIHEETKTSLQAVFTPEQMKKFVAMQEKRQQARKERMANKK